MPISIMSTATVIIKYSFKVRETEDVFSLFCSIEILLICMNPDMQHLIIRPVLLPDKRISLTG